MRIKLKKTVMVTGYGSQPIRKGKIVTVSDAEGKAFIASGYAAAAKDGDKDGELLPPSPLAGTPVSGVTEKNTDVSKDESEEDAGPTANRQRGGNNRR